MEPTESRAQCVAKIANVRGLVQMLQSIKANAKQVLLLLPYIETQLSSSTSYWLV